MIENTDHPTWRPSFEVQGPHAMRLLDSSLQLPLITPQVLRWTLAAISSSLIIRSSRISGHEIGNLTWTLGDVTRGGCPSDFDIEELTEVAPKSRDQLRDPIWCEIRQTRLL